MNEIYNKVLDAMDEGLLTFMKKVPEPRKEAFQDHFVYCYTEKSIHQAIILKLVRMISGLRATQLLAEHGFVQEQASLQRMLDEIIESVEFLSYAVISGDITERHKEYLEAFYEEMDIESSRNRPMIPRKKLRRYIESMEKKFSQMAGENKDIDKDVDPSRILTKVYSDCLHAAAPAIMSLYYGEAKTFHTKGVVGTPRYEEHILDFMHVMFRAILSFTPASAAFREKSVLNKIKEASKPFNELYFRHSPQVRTSRKVSGNV
jgi:hypothetical protein